MPDVLEHVAKMRPPGQALGRHARQLAERPVVQAHAQIRLEHHDAVVDRLEQRVQVAQVLLLDLDRGVAEHRERLRHAADLVVPASGRQWRAEVAAGDREHAVAERGEPGDQVAPDVQPDDQARAGEAQHDDRDQHARAEPLHRERLELAVAMSPWRPDQPVHRRRELPRQSRVLAQAGPWRGR